MATASGCPGIAKDAPANGGCEPAETTEQQQVSLVDTRHYYLFRIKP